MITGTMRSRGEIVPDLVLQGLRRDRRADRRKLPTLASQDVPCFARLSKISSPMSPVCRWAMPQTRPSATGVTALVCAPDMGGRRRRPRRRTRESAKPKRWRPRIWSAGARNRAGREARYSASPLPTASLRFCQPRASDCVLSRIRRHSHRPERRATRSRERRRQGLGKRLPLSPSRNRAMESAGDEFALGSVGAGRGAMAGLVKGGMGSASLDLRRRDHRRSAGRESTRWAPRSCRTARRTGRGHSRSTANSADRRPAGRRAWT